MRNTQLFILSEKEYSILVDLPRPGHPCELAQFSFRNSKFGSATIQTDYNVSEHLQNGFVNILWFGTTDARLRAQFLLVD
jgi:hypothetical protein